jgi:hypothetical protein
MAEPDPGKNQQAGVVDHPGQILLAALLVPPDPLITRQNGLGCPSQQDTAQQSRWTLDEVAQEASDRLAVAQIMIPINVFIPHMAALSAFDHLQTNRIHLG